MIHLREKQLGQQNEMHSVQREITHKQEELQRCLSFFQNENEKEQKIKNQKQLLERDLEKK